MMKLVLILSAFLVSFSGQSQSLNHSSSPKDSSASCIAYWKLGETKIYSIVHEKKTIDPVSKTPPFEFAYEAWVSVIDSTAKTYTIKWVFHLTPELANSLPFYNGMQMIFKTTDMGEFIELLNWEEVRDTYSRMMELSLPKKMDSVAASAFRSAKSVFNSRERVESSMIKEIQLFYMPYGYKFTTSMVGSRTQISNPFGGDPFPAIRTTMIKGLDPRTDTFMLAFHLRMDKANINSMVDSLLKETNTKNEQEMKATKEKYPSIDIHDYSEYGFIRSSGWIRRLYYKRTAVAAGITQSDTYIIRLKD